MPKLNKETDRCKKQFFEDYLDPEILMWLRVSRGKTRPEMAKLFELNTPYSYARFEGKGMSRFTLGISRLRKICEYLKLDPLELCDLLRYHPFSERELKNFRMACKATDQTPLEVLRYFMKAFYKEVSNNA